MPGATDYATLVLQLQSSPFRRELDASHQHLQSFAASAAKIAKGVAAAFMEAGFLKGSLKEYAAQEDAIKKLDAALRKNGDNVSAWASKYQRFAGEMQSQTIYADDAILAQMAYARNLGVTADKLDEAAMAAAGLAARYNIDLGSAMQLIGRASKGHTEMLARYGIVLDENLSPQEKFVQLLKIGSSSFALAKAEAQTLIGSMKQLKNLWGDFKEVIGAQLEAPLRAAISAIKGALEAFNGLSQGMQTFIARSIIIGTSFAALKMAIGGVVGLLQMKNTLMGRSAAAMAAETAAVGMNTAALRANAAARSFGGNPLVNSPMLGASEMAFRRSELLAGNSAQRYIAQNRYATWGQMGRGEALTSLMGRGAASVPKTPGFADRASSAIGLANIPASLKAFGSSGSLLSMLPGVQAAIGALTSNLAAFGTVAGIAGAGVAALGAAWGGLKFGQWIRDITGLGAVMDDFYDRLFNGGEIGKMNEDSRKRDTDTAKKLQDLEKEKQRRKEESAKKLAEDEEMSGLSRNARNASWDFAFRQGDKQTQLSMLNGKMLDLKYAQETAASEKERLDYFMEALKIKEEQLGLEKQIADEQKQRAEEQKSFLKDMKEYGFGEMLKNADPTEQAKMLSEKVKALLGGIDPSNGWSKEEFEALKEARGYQSQLDELSKPEATKRESTVTDAVEKGTLAALKLENMTSTRQDGEYVRKTADESKKTNELLQKLIEQLKTGAVELETVAAV